MAIDDEGKAFELSPDPLINSLKQIIKSIHLGEEYDYDKLLEPILSNKNIFGVDLYEIGMASTVCSYFKEMTSGYGAVRKTLEEYV